MIAGLHGVNPVVIRGGVVGRVFEDAFEDGDFFLHRGFGIAVVVEAIAEGVREEDAGFDVVRLHPDQLAVYGDGFSFCVGIIGCIGLGCFYIKAIGFAGFVFETHGLREGRAGVNLVGTAAKAFGLGESPVAHGAVGVGADGLLKGAGGFVIPEVVEEAEPLIAT